MMPSVVRSYARTRSIETPKTLIVVMARPIAVKPATAPPACLRHASMPAISAWRRRYKSDTREARATACVTSVRRKSAIVGTRMIGSVHFLPTPAFVIMSLRDPVAPRMAEVWLPIAARRTIHGNAGTTRSEAKKMAVPPNSARGGRSTTRIDATRTTKTNYEMY